MFSRGGRVPGRHSWDHPARRAQRVAPSGPAGPHWSAEPGAVPAGVAGTGAPAGPYDISQAPPGVPRLDLGSLRVRLVPGVQARVPAARGGPAHQVYLVHGPSTLQVGAFAAPRSEPLWDQVRQELRESLLSSGAEVVEQAGEHGPELMVRMPTGDGSAPLRFAGVDGPRWMVRAVYRGPAATGGPGAWELAECLRQLVVDRGEEARPPREPLPLRLPERPPDPRGGAAGPADSVAVPYPRGPVDGPGTDPGGR